MRGLFVKFVAEFGQNMAGAEVENPMDRVDSKGVDVILGEPEEGVVDDKAADSIAKGVVVVHSASPRRPVLIGVIRPEFSQVVPFRADVVINNVEYYRKARSMASVHEAFQSVGTAVGRMRGV